MPIDVLHSGRRPKFVWSMDTRPWRRDESDFNNMVVRWKALAYKMSPGYAFV